MEYNIVVPDRADPTTKTGFFSLFNVPTGDFRASGVLDVEFTIAYPLDTYPIVDAHVTRSPQFAGSDFAF